MMLEISAGDAAVLDAITLRLAIAVRSAEVFLILNRRAGRLVANGKSAVKLTNSNGDRHTTSLA